MAMSPLNRFYATMLITMVVALAFGAMIPLTGNPLFVFTFGITATLGVIFLFRIKCPESGVNVGYRGTVSGVLPIYAGFVPSKCQNCGHDLRRKA